MNKCSFDPSVYTDTPLGMFHCPECGEMVVPGTAHPDYTPSIWDRIVSWWTWSIIRHRRRLSDKDLLELERAVKNEIQCCYLCGKPTKPTAWCIAYDPEHDHNVWGMDTYEPVALVCEECGRAIGTISTERRNPC